MLFRSGQVALLDDFLLGCINAISFVQIQQKRRLQNRRMERSLPWRSPTLLASSSICSLEPEADVGNEMKSKESKQTIFVGLVLSDKRRSFIPLFRSSSCRALCRLESDLCSKRSFWNILARFSRVCCQKKIEMVQYGKILI